MPTHTLQVPQKPRVLSNPLNNIASTCAWRRMRCECATNQACTMPSTMSRHGKLPLIVVPNAFGGQRQAWQGPADACFWAACMHAIDPLNAAALHAGWGTQAYQAHLPR